MLFKKKTVAGFYLFLINICAMTPLGDLQFLKKDGSCYLVLPFHDKNGISGCELAIKSPVGDFIYTSFQPIDYDINFIQIEYFLI